jgi:FdhE protein
MPLLRAEQVTVNARALAKHWSAVCRAVARHQPTDSAKATCTIVESVGVDAAGILRQVLQEGPTAIHERAEQLGGDPTLFAATFRLACYRPMSAARHHFHAVPGDFPWNGGGWDRGYCPVCGSWPLLGEFRGLEQTRFLRCGLCAASWPFPRLRCPFCDTSNHQQLAYFHVEGEQDRFRAATCDACRRYVKMASTLAELSTPMLLVEDLATLHLDLAAADRGFFVG